MSFEERARARLKELEDGREKFIADAQRQLAAMDGAIGEMRALLDPPAVQNGTSDESAADAVEEAIPLAG